MIAMKYSRYIKIQNDYAQRQCVWCDVYVWKQKKMRVTHGIVPHGLCWICNLQPVNKILSSHFRI